MSGILKKKIKNMFNYFLIFQQIWKDDVVVIKQTT